MPSLRASLGQVDYFAAARVRRSLIAIASDPSECGARSM